MSDKSAIEWCDATWNPVTGCTEVSPGCDHCYAKTFAERWRGTPGHHFENGFDVTLRPDKLALPLSWRKPRRVFVNSMSDLFHASVPDEYIARVFAVMACSPRHTFQVLTKRHGRMRSLLSNQSFRRLVYDTAAEVDQAGVFDPYRYGPERFVPTHYNQPAGYRSDDSDWWPLPNVWLGCSVENQHWANIRIPALVDTPASVRFLSCEPLLEPVDLTSWMPPGRASWQCSGCHRFYSGPAQETCPGCGRIGYWSDSHAGNGRPNGQPIGWVITGGESGPGARPMHPDWARTLRDQCQAATVPFLFKQWGEWGPASWHVSVCDPRVGWRGTNEELVEAKRAAEARGATHHLQSSGHLYQPPHKPWSIERDPDGHYPGAVRRWGKKRAGRLLDGRTWDQYPELVVGP